jgi:hypothetical protein
MGHKFLVAAFCCTWAIQLGYVLWIAAKWSGQEVKLGHLSGGRR